MSRADHEGTSGANGQRRLWKTIWGAEVLNKIKNFVWRACQNILPTKSNLCRPQVINSDTYEQCDRCSETTSHILLHCDFSSAVWEACGLVVDRDSLFMDYLWKRCDELGLADVNLPHFMAIAWNLWRNRNGVRHGETPKTVENLIFEASQFVIAYQALQDCPTPSKIPLPPQWTPLVSGFFKANVDGAVFKDHSSVGIGVVLWDDKGSVIGALSQRIYAPLGPLEAEAKVMEAAMLFARDMRIHDIVFEGDSLQVRNFLKCSSLVPLAVANVLEGILFHPQFFRCFCFSHIRKAGNKPTYLLA